MKWPMHGRPKASPGHFWQGLFRNECSRKPAAHLPQAEQVSASCKTDRSASLEKVVVHHEIDPYTGYQIKYA